MRGKRFLFHDPPGRACCFMERRGIWVGVICVFLVGAVCSLFDACPCSSFGSLRPCAFWASAVAEEASGDHFAALDDSLLWPMSLPPRVTSTFGEYRKTHFHAGIDLSTYGRSGYALRAVGKGSLWRVRVDPDGYGNMLYLRLDDGRIVVFAHMERFARKIRDCVQEMQEETGRCVVDFYPEPDRVRFAKGEIVGTAGGTGVGPPHLHMELRDRNNDPINPLLGPYALPDSTPPRFYRFVMSPRGAEARINGRRRSRTIRLRFDRDTKTYQALATPQLWGEIGLSVRAFDRVNLGGDKVGIYEFVVEVDGEEIFNRVYERMAIDQWKLIDLVHDRDLRRRGFGQCERLYRLQGDDLQFHEQSPGDGIIRAGIGDIEYGDHLIEVIIRDAAGNSRHAELPFLVNKPPEVRFLSWIGEDSLRIVIQDEDPLSCEAKFRLKHQGRWRSLNTLLHERGVWKVTEPPPGCLLECTIIDPHGMKSPPYYHGIVLEGEGELRCAVRYDIEPTLISVTLEGQVDLARPPVVFVAPGKLAYTPARMRAVNERKYEMELTLLPEVVPLYRILFTMEGLDGRVGRKELKIPLQALLVEEGSVVGDGDARISAARGAVFSDTYIQVIERSLSVPQNGLELLTAGYQFKPEETVLKRPVRVSLLVPESAMNQGSEGGIGLFRWAGSSYKIVGASWDSSAAAVGGTTESLGTFALLRDPYAPCVEISPRQGMVVTGRRPTLRATVSDHGSGIAKESVQMYVDGRAVPACPMGGGSWVYRPRSNLPRGLHTVRMVVRDKVGNPGAAQVTFRIR